MQYRIELDEELRALIIRIEGALSAAGIEASIKDLLAHPSWRPGTNLLIDARGAETQHLGDDERHDIASTFKAAADGIGDGCCAWVVANLFDFGLGKMWEACMGPNVRFKIGIYLSMDKAYLWLRGAEPFG